MKPYLEKAIDEIDAAIFTGDDFHNDYDRIEFVRYLARWGRAIGEIDVVRKAEESIESSKEKFFVSEIKTDVPNRNGIVITKQSLMGALEKFFSDGLPKPVFYEDNMIPAGSVNSFKETPYGISFTFKLEDNFWGNEVLNEQRGK